ncbi:Mor transcription activator domain protein [Leptothrix cholodnii SP-6]|uniref:Mor transcription activator domain protein n=1 Tax=Leptothrix cholodnii (strain ATCC 51168 / LMG 8142 / SP-6) TaxID=395495 RepID=B1Y429_LEPCP|nr:Mor transcription activator family protein [Leptothrix cholodnii]ACB34551.1 Mor transcription activator domain protein [Leptothrix cholodnii SP-6]
MRKGKPKPAEIIGRLVDIGVERLVADAGIDADMARTIIREVAHIFFSEYGGNEIYFPKDLAFPLYRRDVAIWREFTGTNGWELARRHGLSERQIRYICEAMRKQAVRLNQLELPGLDEPD